MKTKTWSLTILLVLAAAACGDSADTSDLEAELAALEGQLSTLQDQLDDAEAAEAMGASTIASLQSSLDDAETALATAQTNLTTNATTIADLNAQIATLQGQLGAIETVLAGIAGTITLDLPFVFGDASLELDTAYPIAGTDDSASFSEVRYWLTNVSLVREGDSTYDVPDAYYLVEVRGEQTNGDLTETPLVYPATRRERIVLSGVPAGVYTGIRFHVGVDAAHNDNLANYAGELHVLQNMVDISWMWLTSYVFTKTRGTVTGETTQAFAWDNGTNADYREVEFAFGEDAAVSLNAPWRVEIEADLASLVTDVEPRTRPNIGAGNAANRTLLADAFVDMFTLTAVEAAP